MYRRPFHTYQDGRTHTCSTVAAPASYHKRWHGQHAWCCALTSFLHCKSMDHLTDVEIGNSTTHGWKTPPVGKSSHTSPRHAQYVSTAHGRLPQPSFSPHKRQHHAAVGRLHASFWHTAGVCHGRLEAHAARRAAQRATEPRFHGSRLHYQPLFCLPQRVPTSA